MARAPKPSPIASSQEVLPPPDWTAIKTAYVSGVLPIATLCEVYSIPRAQLMRRALTEGWERNQQAALIAEVRRQVHEGIASDDLEPHVQAEAAAIVQVLSDHRGTARSLRSLIDEAADEIRNIMRAATEDQELEPEDQAALARKMPMLSMLIGKGSLVSAIDTLTNAALKIVPLERSIMGIDAIMPNQTPAAGSALSPSGVTVQVYIPDNNRSNTNG